MIGLTSRRVSREFSLVYGMMCEKYLPLTVSMESEG
jgi:hypothetical protein